MRRIRFFRILLPIVLVAFVAVLVWAIQLPSGPFRAPSGRPVSGAEGVTFTEISGNQTKYRVRAQSVTEDEAGKLLLEWIDSVEYHRADKLPLIISAALGNIDGKPGHKMLHFENGVRITDPEDGLVLSIPRLEVDQAAGEARASGDVRLEGGLSGGASKVIYGLEGQPTQLFDLDLEDAGGGRLAARRALLHDGLDDIELLREVRLERQAEHLSADRIRLRRGPEKRPRQAHARGQVRGSWQPPSGLPVAVECDKATVRWDDDGRPMRLDLGGKARIRRGDDSLLARHVRVWRQGSEAAPTWGLAANGSAVFQGSFGSAPALLRAQSLEARFAEGLAIEQGSAQGRVSFDSSDTRGEAERAEFDRSSGGRIQLFGSERRKARLSRGPTRVAADQIATDPKGDRLLAERRVEATLLPQPAASAGAGLFRTDEAVHFVAERLEGRQGGAHLEFRGQVRGWQGERSLSASQVALDQDQRTLVAEENVDLQIPREHEAPSVAQSDYIQIAAEKLNYSDAAGLAVFEEQVRVRLAEGWVEARRLEVDLAEDGKEIREIRASGEVRIEFRKPEEQGELPKVISGEADRLVYTPAEPTVWLFGDEAPAAVRRVGEGGATTTGRVLRYRLDLGTLSVEAGRTST